MVFRATPRLVPALLDGSEQGITLDGSPLRGELTINGFALERHPQPQPSASFAAGKLTIFLHAGRAFRKSAQLTSSPVQSPMNATTAVLLLVALFSAGSSVSHGQQDAKSEAPAA